MRIVSTCVLSALISIAVQAQEPKTLTLKDGDLVVFLGDGFIEEEARYGYLESQLTARFPGQRLRFKSIPVASGPMPRRLMDLDEKSLEETIARLRPALVVFSFGMAESLEGQAGLAAFTAAYQKLVARSTAAGAKSVLLAPHRHEDLGGELADPAEHNQGLRLYADAIGKIAQDAGSWTVNLFDALTDDPKNGPPRFLTRDGIALNRYGHWRAASVACESFGLPQKRWIVEVDAPSGRTSVEGTRVRDLVSSPREVEFTLLDAVLPDPLPQAEAGARFLRTGRLLRVAGLAEGAYSLTIDDEKISTIAAEDLSNGMELWAGPEFEQAEDLRRTVVVKNELLGSIAKSPSADGAKMLQNLEAANERIADLEERIFRQAIPKARVYRIVPEVAER